MIAPVFILAGEPSGDRLAASLMNAVNNAWGAQDWIGVGGPAMQGEGLRTDIDMDALTIFGFGAALAAYPRLSRLADRLVDRVMAARPRAVITVDVKGFSRAEGKFKDITEGDLPWGDVRKALDDIGFTGWATAEVGGGDVARLKKVREDMERAFDNKVMLKLWVKVKSGWSDDARALKTLGIDPLGDA